MPGGRVKRDASAKREKAMRVHSFDLTSNAYKRDPFPVLAALRDVGPVVTTRVPILGNTTFVTTHAAVEMLLKDKDNFSTQIENGRNSRIATIIRFMPRNLRLIAQNMLQKDGAEHRRLRKLVDGAFRRGEIEAWRPRIEAIADRLLDRWQASPDRDLVRHVARDLPLAVICELLGLPDADRPKFSRWMSSLSEMTSLWGFVRFLPAVGKINRYLTACFQERRVAPRDDLISALVHANDAGDRMTDDELLAMLFLLFVAGHETTTHLISGGVLALLQNPDQLQRLRHDPGLIPSAVDELLRYVTPVEITKPRFPFADMTFEGVAMAKGQLVMAHLAAANSDPAAFTDAETLDLGREKNRHVAFGGGPHFCLGAWFAKAEMEVLLQRLLARASTLALAVPESELRWTERIGLRALERLPLTL